MLFSRASYFEFRHFEFRYLEFHPAPETLPAFIYRMSAQPLTTTTANIALAIATIIIVLAGAFLLWHWELGPAARRTPQYSRVRQISASWYYFAAMCAFVLLAGFLAQALFMQCHGWLYPETPSSSGFVQMLAGGIFDAGAIAAVLYARRFLFAIEHLPRLAVIAHAAPKPAPPIPPAKAILAGIGVFCIARTVFIPVAFLWDQFLKLARIDALDQDLIQVFRDEPSPARIATMTIIATIVAPVAEEMLFRGGLFGYIRTRAQRLSALLAVSFIFALVHLNLRSFPLLLVFSITLCIAYERTGRLTTPIIAHALLNLSTIGLILLDLA
jgi:membrane protease YdiL (CAAX protease family)